MHAAKFPPGSALIGPVSPEEVVHVTVALNTDDPGTVEAIRGHFRDVHGLAAVVRHGRYLHIHATSAEVCGAFRVILWNYSHPDVGVFRHHALPAYLYPEIEPHVTAVLGLSSGFRAKPHTRVSSPHAAFKGYYASDVARMYEFPRGDGEGQAVALIELGGGFDLASLKAYAARLNLPTPNISVVSVDGAVNVPDKDPEGADGEVMLDIAVVMAVALKAAIVVYFAPNTDQGFLDAIAAAANDKVHKPSIISISWGGPESSWSKSVMTAFDQAFARAGAAGITVLAASGDDGSTDGARGQNVDFPASSPNVVGCGGTEITVSGGVITSEVVWNDLPSGGAGGGGTSTAFPAPAWQEKDGIRQGMRCVPDVSGNASPNSGYRVPVDGSDAIIGGTSAVAPLYAGLMAILNQRTGRRLGFINPGLYAAKSSSYVDVTKGNNGYFDATAGYDMASGLGRINGSKLLANLPPVLPHATA